jgi:hypothetical protein
MKKLLATGVAMVVAAGAMAQGLGGLPVGQNVGGVEPGKFVAGTHVTLLGTGAGADPIFGHDISSKYALALVAHGSYGVMENLSVGAGLGFQKIKGEVKDVTTSGSLDGGLDFSLAGQYEFPGKDTSLPVDLAVRLGYNYLKGSASPGGDGAIKKIEISDSGITILGIVSKKLDSVDGLFLYGGLGYWLAMGEVKMTANVRDAQDDVVLAALKSDMKSQFILDVGGKYAVSETMNYFAEFAYMDSFGFTFGVNYGF